MQLDVVGGVGLDDGGYLQPDVGGSMGLGLGDKDGTFGWVLVQLPFLVLKAKLSDDLLGNSGLWL